MRLKIEVDGSSLAHDVRSVEHVGRKLVELGEMIQFFVASGDGDTFADFVEFMTDFDDMAPSTRTAAEQSGFTGIIAEKQP